MKKPARGLNGRRFFLWRGVRGKRRAIVVRTPSFALARALAAGRFCCRMQAFQGDFANVLQMHSIFKLHSANLHFSKCRVNPHSVSFDIHPACMGTYSFHMRGAYSSPGCPGLAPHSAKGKLSTDFSCFDSTLRSIHGRCGWFAAFLCKFCRPFASLSHVGMSGPRGRRKICTIPGLCGAA